MKVHELIEILKELPQTDDVLIDIHVEHHNKLSPISDGIPIEHVYCGFDWDSGKTFLCPVEELALSNKKKVEYEFK